MGGRNLTGEEVCVHLERFAEKQKIIFIISITELSEMMYMKCTTQTSISKSLYSYTM